MSCRILSIRRSGFTVTPSVIPKWRMAPHPAQPAATSYAKPANGTLPRKESAWCLVWGSLRTETESLGCKALSPSLQLITGNSTAIPNLHCIFSYMFCQHELADARHWAMIGNCLWVRGVPLGSFRWCFTSVAWRFWGL